MRINYSILMRQLKQYKKTQPIFNRLYKTIQYHDKNWQHTLCSVCFFGLLAFANNQAIAASFNSDISSHMLTKKSLNNKQLNTNDDIDLTTQNNTSALPRVSLVDINAGQLLFTHQNKSKFLQAPMLNNEVNIAIKGVVANATVIQAFKNTTENWQHAMYVFPLPDNAAINALKITLNNREIIGVIKEKKSAEKTFLQAKSAGKKAALLEQIRPNLFSVNIANIPPNESINVELTYFQQVDIKKEYGKHIFSIDYPMAITPRYTPDDYEAHIDEPAIPNLIYSKAINTNDVISKNTKSIHNPHNVNFSLTLNSGAEIENIKSLYHSVVLEKKKNQTFNISMPLEPLEKDFELQWTYKQNPMPKAVNFTTEYQGDNYGLLMVFPGNKSEKSSASNNNQPRQLTFILDTSGSMSGQSLKQAKRAIKQGLKTLKSTDYLQLITFSNKAEQLFNTPMLATTSNKKRVAQHIASISANGGTNIKQALAIALPSPTQNQQAIIENSRLEQIIFLTDGAVGNEAEIFTMINHNIDKKRLFTVGLGSAPNRYFMKRAAQIGRGTYHFIGNANELVPTMSRIFKQLSEPVLTNIAMTLSQTNNQGTEPLKVTTSPNPIPDLYAGEPVILSYKISANNEKKNENINNVSAMLSANYLDTKWRHPFLLSPSTIETTLHQPHEVSSAIKARTKNDVNTKNIPALATLWAKRKIDEHYNALMLNRNSKDKDAVIALALEFNLVSPFTSFVAVDTEISKPIHKAVTNKQLVNNLPAGQRLPQTALNWKKQLLNSVVFLLLAVSILILGQQYKAVFVMAKKEACDGNEH